MRCTRARTRSCLAMTCFKAMPFHSKALSRSRGCELPGKLSVARRLHRHVCLRASRDDATPESSDHAENLYAHTSPRPIGGEYGQGFINLTSRGTTVRLDVDDLNEQLAAKGRLRLRHSMKPDEGYGVIFHWDDVVCNTKQMQRRAWESVAHSIGRELPAIERPQMYAVRPERAIMDMLHWTRSMTEAQRLARDVAAAYAHEFRSVDRPIDGVVQWLNALQTSRVPCAVLSNIERALLVEALERMGLQNRFAALVSAEDGMLTSSQSLLSAAIKLGRPPNKCVAFVSNASCVAAAHNCSMKAVAMVGVHPSFQMRTADLTCSSMAELTVYNIRRLFANAGSEFMDLRKLPNSDTPSGKKPTASATID